jgi:4-nitrophenyl phosphatase
LIPVICDLDGVVYRGTTPIPGSPEALRRLITAAVDVCFVTNNSTRPPDAAADKVTRVAGVTVRPGQIITSSMAAATLLTPADAPVLVVGEEGVSHAVTGEGLAITDDPIEAKSVVVGMTRSVTYDLIGVAAEALRRGARFVATNIDPTFPTEQGLMPGSGAIVAAVATASGRSPEVAGKPNPPMISLIRSKVGPDAWVIGDRVDTDIALARAEPGWRSVLVLTGVSSRTDAASSDADFVVADLAAAVDLILTEAE